MTNVYVKIEDYKGVLAILENIKEKLEDAKSSIERLKKIRIQEDTEFGQWEASLTEIEKRTEAIDKELLGQEGL
ncbi:MAG: hypothetical protein AABY14_03880 [Nanoarchaeota archaeon]